VIARDHALTPRAMHLPIRPWHPCRGWPDVSSGRKEGREMHGGLLWAAFEEWAAHHHCARRSVGLHRHAASEPHRLLLGPVPTAGRPARQRAWPTWPRLKHPEKIQTHTLKALMPPCSPKRYGPVTRPEPCDAPKGGLCLCWGALFRDKGVSQAWQSQAPRGDVSPLVTCVTCMPKSV